MRDGCIDILAGSLGTGDLGGDDELVANIAGVNQVNDGGLRCRSVRRQMVRSTMNVDSGV